MEQAYKKRSPRATANSPPVLADMGVLYKSGKFIKSIAVSKENPRHILSFAFGIPHHGMTSWQTQRSDSIISC